MEEAAASLRTELDDPPPLQADAIPDNAWTGARAHRPIAEPVRAVTRRPRVVHESAPSGMNGADINGSQQRALNALAWWAALRKDEPTVPMIAVVAGWKPSSGGTNNRISELCTMSIAERPKPGEVTLQKWLVL